MRKWYQSEPPEGSLRALGGDGRQFEVPGQLVRHVINILHRKPNVAANAALRIRGDIREALQFLIDGDHLTDKQYELIGEALPAAIRGKIGKIDENEVYLATIIEKAGRLNRRKIFDALSL